jgi:hypothetical protein
MATPLDILGTTASALQIVGLICPLGNRILDKPKDTKALRVICIEAKRYALLLTEWETKMKNEVRKACVALQKELEGIVDDIKSLRKRKPLVKAKDCLRLYKQEFHEWYQDAVEEFQFRMSVEGLSPDSTGSTSVCAGTKRTRDPCGRHLGVGAQERA